MLQQKLVQKLSQRLVMTPTLQQAIKLLQLSRLELEGLLQQEMVQNPVLEEEQTEEPYTPEPGKPETSSEPESMAAAKEVVVGEEKHMQEIDITAYFQDYDETPMRHHFSEEAPQFSYENTLATTPSLADHLLWQLDLSTSDEELMEIGRAVIGNLNDAGYLRATIEEIQAMGDWSEPRVQAARSLIQRLDPIGCGSLNLRECLLLQFEVHEIDDPIALAIVRDLLHLFLNSQFDKLAKQLGVDLHRIMLAREVIRQLDPNPGRKFSSVQTHYITPDVMVLKEEDGSYRVMLNEDGLPKLRISPTYRRLLQAGDSGGEVQSYIKDKFRSAMWLIKSFEQRQRTIFKVAESIVHHQREFLEHGISQLRPLILRDIAEDIGMHESTVSRVVTNKYMFTPQGVFEMKFFFHSGISGRAGEEVSSLSVKEKIKRLIEAEQAQQPLSDAQIVEILSREGLTIARRTVAKYRDELKIPASKLRRYASR
ncbi:MAG TPA: RNA polymerase factor sigma-54 [Acidobacteriota bacterium]